MKAKVAMYKLCGISWDAFTPWAMTPDGSEPVLSNYVRATQWVEVDFPERSAAELIPDQLAALDAKEQELRAAFMEKLNELAEARAKLRALTHEVAP